MGSSSGAFHLQSNGRRPGHRDHVALVRRITRSDEPALAQFYQATSGLLFGLVLHTLRDTAAAEEVLALVYEDIRQEAAWFEPRQTCVLVWLVTLAHWHAYERLRSSKTSEQPAVLIGPGERRSSALKNFGENRSEHQRLVSATLVSLSPRQLQMIELAYFSRMAPLEIALRLGQRLEIVKAGLQDGILKLCRLFKNDCPAHNNQKARVTLSLTTSH